MEGNTAASCSEILQFLARDGCIAHLHELTCSYRWRNKGLLTLHFHNTDRVDGGHPYWTLENGGGGGGHTEKEARCHFTTTIFLA